MKLSLVFAFSLTALILFQDCEAVEKVTGKVARTIPVESYVYVQLEEQELWIAITPTKLGVGDLVEYTGGALMKDFYSRQLDRSFESILFVTNFEVIERANPHDSIPGFTGHDQNNSEMNPEPAEIMASPRADEIERLEKGLTVRQIFENRDGLADSEIAIRAKVMKVNSGILGKNWITLEDGTGEPPQDRLIATTNEEVSPGRILVATGILKVDVDLGSGYLYKVILENARFSD